MSPTKLTLEVFEKLHAAMEPAAPTCTASDLGFTTCEDPSCEDPS